MISINKKIYVTGALLGLTAVLIGAFGAHALENLIDNDSRQTFETGVKYQMYHALFLLLVGQINVLSEGSKKTVWYLVVIGVLLFSGSIYLLATNKLSGFDFRAIGFITPIGGSLLIAAWAFLFVKLLKIRAK